MVAGACPKEALTAKNHQWDTAGSNIGASSCSDLDRIGLLLIYVLSCIANELQTLAHVLCLKLDLSLHFFKNRNFSYGLANCFASLSSLLLNQLRR